uniref:Uncharacterized protein n=1 Tax=Ciona savignyi TaxID=51511 RepID=H2YS61_CIOSA
MVDLFKSHEEQRVKLRVQHAIEREKLIISCEQQKMRVHSRAARTIHNQQIPFSACSMLMNNEVYNVPRQAMDEPRKTFHQRSIQCANVYSLVAGCERYVR